jgi:hypothetical protein
MSNLNSVCFWGCSREALRAGSRFKAYGRRYLLIVICSEGYRLSGIRGESLGHPLLYKFLYLTF